MVLLIALVPLAWMSVAHAQQDAPAVAATAKSSAPPPKAGHGKAAAAPAKGVHAGTKTNGGHYPPRQRASMAQYQNAVTPPLDTGR
ncbi:hypothetical protein [Dyella sedimenti]|uniref:hypothetical protein n=1 Tax=Dyella sedimenti TaxID=2919947 RepID=UPI001FA99742|nr:hypothetical protein [Dyella sedimenti]